MIRFPLVVFAALLLSVPQVHAQSSVDVVGSAAVHFIHNCPHVFGEDTCVVLGGWSGAAAVGLSSRLSLVGEIGRFGGSLEYPRDADVRAYGFLAGPRIGWRRDRVWRPFAQLLAGAVRTTGSSLDMVFVGVCLEFRNSAECQLVEMRVTSSATSFAVQPGGGVDIGPARGRFALRLGLDLRPAHESERFDTTAPVYQTTLGAQAHKALALSKGEQVELRFTSGLVWRVAR